MYPFAIITPSAPGVKGVCTSAGTSSSPTTFNLTNCTSLRRYSLLSESTYNSAGSPAAAARPFSNKSVNPFIVGIAAIYRILRLLTFRITPIGSSIITPPPVFLFSAFSAYFSAIPSILSWKRSSWRTAWRSHSCVFCRCRSRSRSRS